MLCEYGCNNEAQYQTKEGKNICLPSPNSCPENRKKNTNGLKKAYSEGRKEGWPITDEQRAWSRGKTLWTDSRLSRTNLPENIFVENSTSSGGLAKRILIKEKLVENKCSKCGINEWLDDVIVLEMDHINGDNKDNRIENLRLLCPNCHSQTPGWRGRNARRSHKDYIADEEFINVLRETPSIRQALLKLGLAAKGGNYERAKRLKDQMGV